LKEWKAKAIGSMKRESRIQKTQARDARAYQEVMEEMLREADELDARLEQHVRRTVAGREIEVLQVQGVGPWYVARWQGFPEPHRVVRVLCRSTEDGRFSLLREYRVPLRVGSPRLTVLDYVD
jgi:hypothetical protein